MSNYVFRKSTGFTEVLISLILLSAILNGVAVVYGYHQYELLVSAKNGVDVNMDEAGSILVHQLMIKVAQLGFRVIVGIQFLMWVYRMSRNAHCVKTGKPTSSPGWAVGCYFIPILNMWKPYLIMKEIYEAFRQRPSYSKVLPLWWTAWVLSSAVGGFTSYYMSRAETVGELLVASRWAIALDVSLVFLDVAAALMVYVVNEASVEWYEVTQYEDLGVYWELV
ncbi:DUF4328 domain-containing protein [Gimesia maris]|uniref:DUF4328 domain-containing protein n=1 Tax=Gimesia maris TaxID=122 RepID=UPI0030DC37B2